jgi:hypothetical protein
MSRRCAAACASAAEMPLMRILVLSLKARPASSLRTCLISESTSSATDSLALMCPSSAYATAQASRLCLARVRPQR